MSQTTPSPTPYESYDTEKLVSLVLCCDIFHYVLIYIYHVFFFRSATFMDFIISKSFIAILIVEVLSVFIFLTYIPNCL